MSKIYISIPNNRGSTEIHEARPYQADAYKKFMDSIAADSNITEIEYEYEGGVIFKLQKFDGQHLESDYSMFCNMVREGDDSPSYILSDNKDKLSGYVDWEARMSGRGGGYKRKSTKRKSTKRKSKRKSTKRKSTKRKSTKRK